MNKLFNINPINNKALSQLAKNVKFKIVGSFLQPHCISNAQSIPNYSDKFLYNFKTGSFYNHFIK